MWLVWTEGLCSIIDLDAVAGDDEEMISMP